MKNIDCFSSALRVVTFNMHGFNTGSNCLCKLMDNYDIILLQEHMFIDEDVNLITSCNVNVNFNNFLVASEHNGIAGRPACWWHCSLTRS